MNCPCCVQSSFKFPSVSEGKKKNQVAWKEPRLGKMGMMEKDVRSRAVYMLRSMMILDSWAKIREPTQLSFVGFCDPRAAPPTRLASQCAGVARPFQRVGCSLIKGSLPFGDGALLLSCGLRVSRRGRCGARSWRLIFAFFRNFSVLLGLLKSTWLF